MAFLLAVIALVPLLITPGLLFYYDVNPKLAILLVGTAVAGVWWALRGPGARALLARRAGRVFCWLLAAQGASLLLSASLSREPALSFGGTNWRRFGAIPQCAVLLLAFLTAVNTASDKRRLNSVLRAISVSGIPIAAYGILQYFGWDPWLPAQAYHAGEGIWTIVRPPGTLGHADYFGVYCVYTFFTNLTLILGGETRFRDGALFGWRALAGFGAVLSAVAVILSGTRSALLGLVAGCCVFAVWVRPRFDRRTAGAGVALAAVAIGFYLSPAGALLRSRVHWAKEDAGGGARALLWRDSARMALQRPLAGYGPETFSLAFPRFQSVELARAYPDFYQESPHNALLDAFAAQGIAGPVLFFAMAALALVTVWRARRKAPALAGGLAASIFAALVSHLFNSFIMPTALGYFVLLALAMGGLEGAPEKARRRTRPAAALAIVLPAAILFAVMTAQLLRADRVLCRVREDLDSGRIAEAVREHDSARPWPISGAGSELWYSRKLAAAAQAAPAILPRMQALEAGYRAALEAAATADDRQNAYYNLAMYQALRNDAAATERSLRDAIAWAPNWYKPHAALAKLLRQTGRTAEASAEEAVTNQLTDNLQAREHPPG